MSTLSAQPQASSRAVEADAPAEVSRRAARVLIFTAILCVLNLVDLLFTVLAVQIDEFVEMNPLAKGLSVPGLVALKLGMLAACTTIFVALRRRRSVEWGCYFLLAIYGVLAVIWVTEYHFLLSPYQLSLLLAGK